MTDSHSSTELLPREHTSATDSAATKPAPTAAPHESQAAARPLKRGSLQVPAAAQPLRFDWTYVLPIAIIHLLALLAFVPWLFSWTGVALVFIGQYITGTLGICVGYHRLLTHRGFTCPKWLEYTLAVCGVCSLQDSPARWVAIHRLHHRDSDEQPDPHSPLVGFLWGHFGWVLVPNREHAGVGQYERYVRDLLRDPFYLRFERKGFWLLTYFLHAVAVFAIGWLVGIVIYGMTMEAYQFGASIFVWGVLVRTVYVWHCTWSVNSLGHLFGYRNYETSDNSRNNWISAILAYGEGWHNNHHADQRAAAHGHRWWEIDLTWMTIRFLEMVGLARDVVRPRVWTAKHKAATAVPRADEI